MEERKKISLSQVYEEVQKEHRIDNQGMRDIDTFEDKELEQFETAYKMLPDSDVAKIFLISENDVRKLASKRKVYKDSAFTQNQMVVGHEGSYLDVTKKDGSPAEPGFLVRSMAKHITEEEYREVTAMQSEKFVPVELMEDLIRLQLKRVERGFGLEVSNQGMWMSVNSAVDTLQNMIIRYHEMEHGTKSTHVLTINDYILRNQKGI